MKVFSPKRARYYGKIGKWKICEFCNPKVIKKQSSRSLSGKHWMVFINFFPYIDGHLMLIPQRHVIDTKDLNREEKEEFFEMLERTKKKLGKIFKTKAFNIGLNLGREAGDSISHIHWHIVPRKARVANAADIFGDIQTMTMLPQELKKIIDK